MGGGASKALLDASSSQHDAAVAAIAGGNLEEALEICKKTRESVSKLPPSKVGDLLGKLDEVEAEASEQIDKFRERWEGAVDKKVEAEEAAAKGDLGKSKMLYQEAADLFQGAISDVGGPRGKSWLETGGETKVKVTRCHDVFKAGSNSIKWEGGGDDSGIAILGPPISNGEKLVAEVKLANLNTRNEDASIFVGIVTEEGLEMDGFWYDDEYGAQSESSKAWYYSMDGDVCLGEDAVTGFDSDAWAFTVGDTITMELDMTLEAEEPRPGEPQIPSGVLTFMRNGAKVPGVLRGVGGGRVFPAVCFAEASPGDTIDVIELVVDTAEAKPADPSPPEGNIVRAFAGSAQMCAGMVSYVGFSDPDNFSVTISAVRRMLRGAKAVMEEAGRERDTQDCTRKLMEIAGGLKGKLLEKARELMDGAETDLGNSRYKASIHGFKGAQKVFQKVEEGALARAAARQSSTALGRMEVANRKADQLLRRVQNTVSSTEVSQLTMGYMDADTMVLEAELLFEQCGELGKALIAKKLKLVVDRLIEASESNNEGDRLFETGKGSGVAFHFEGAAEMFENARGLLDKEGLSSLVDVVDSKLKLCRENIARIVTADAALEEGGGGVEEMEDAMANYAAAMDVKEDVEEEGAEQSDPTLNGDMTTIRKIGSHCFSVYVAASFSDTQVEREALQQQVWSTVRQAANSFGMEFEMVDPLSLVKEISPLDFDYAFDDECVAEFHRCNQESAGVDFLCLIGADDNGVPFPRSIPFDTYNVMLKHVAEVKQKSAEREAVMEWFKLNTNSNPKCYVLLDKYKKMPALKSHDMKKRNLSWEEWAKELTTLQKAFNFACTQQKFIRRQQEVQVSVFKALGDLDSYKRKEKMEILFSEIDEDGSGEIDREELQACFSTLGVDMPSNEVQSFMSAYDTDGGGTIGFEELQLMMEELLFEARKNLGKAGKDLEMMDVSHTHLFTETHMFNSVMKGILEREDGRHSSRALAVLWGYDLSRGSLPDEAPAEGDAMSDIRAGFQAKNKGVVEARSIERERPSFYRCSDMQIIKGTIAKKLNQMSVGGIGEDQDEGGGDAEDDEAIAGFSDGSDSDGDVDARGVELPGVQAGVDDVGGEESLGGGEGDVVDKEAEQRRGVYKLLRCRKSMLIKSLGLISLKKMASVGRYVELGGTMDSPFKVVRQEVVEQEEGGRGGKEGEDELKMHVREAQAKLDRLEQRMFTMRNAVDRRHAEESMRELQQEIRCLQSDAFHSMFLVVKGKAWLVRHDPKKDQDRRICMLSEGDTFGDSYCMMGTPRDCRVQVESDALLVEWTRRDMGVVLDLSPTAEKKLEAVAKWVAPPILLSDSFTFVPPEVAASSVKVAILEALRLFRSSISLSLEDDEIEQLANSCRLITCPPDGGVGAPKATLYQQGDCDEAGWGPFGRSAFLLLEGEIRLTVVLEGQDELPKEMMRLGERGDCAGEVSLADKHLPRTHTAVLEPGGIVAVISPEAWAAAVPRVVGANRSDVISEVVRLCDETGGNRASVEGRIRSQNVLHALKRRRSTLFKMLQDQEIEYIGAKAKVKEARKGERIMRQGEEGEAVVVVVKGEFRVLVAFAEGEDEREVARLRLGDTVGEMLLVHHTASSSSVVAVSPLCVFAEIPLQKLERLLSKRPEVIDCLEEMVAGGQGQDDLIRARTPMGGRAATPGGAVARGMMESQAVITFPFHTRKGGAHVQRHGGDTYLSTFSRKVTNALLSRIDETLQEVEKARLEPGYETIQEVNWHLGIAKAKTVAFFGREEELERIEQVLSGQLFGTQGLINQPLIVVGEPGVGKSTLMAMAGIRGKTKRPGTVLVLRFCGTSDRSTTWRALVGGIISQLDAVYGEETDHLPSEPSDLKQCLYKAMSRGSEHEHVAVLIDGIDEIETPRGWEPSFEWMPKELPDNSCLICSLKTSSSGHMQALNTLFNGEVYYKIAALKSAKVGSILDKWLLVSGRTGTALSHFEALRDASPNSANLEGTPLNCSPWFVEIVFDMSRSWLSFDKPPTLPTTIQDLILEMVTKLEETYGKKTIERLLSFVIMSRDGATLQELFDLLSCDDDVLDEIFVSSVPIVRRVPDFTCRRLARDTRHLLRDVRNRFEAHCKRLSCALISDLVLERYGLTDKQTKIKYHVYLAHYWMGEWVDGKIEWHNLEPDPHRKIVHWRGINEQPTFYQGRHPMLLHKRDALPNQRKLRELPHHICWASGRTTAVDPISRAVSFKPGKKGEKAERTPMDRQAQAWYEQHVCTMEFVRAACESGLASELSEDLILGRKIFLYSELVTQFQQWMWASVGVLSRNSLLALQEGLNAAGNGRRLINMASQDILNQAVVDDKVAIPLAWIIHTNKDEVLDPLLLRFTGHFKGIFSVCSSANDDLVMTGGADGTVRLYDISSGQEIKRIDAHTAPVRRCRFSKDSKFILTASSEGAAMVFDMVSSDQVCVLSGHDGEVLDAVWIDDNTVVTCSNDMTLIRWHVNYGTKGESADGEVQMRYEGHVGAVTCIMEMTLGTQVVSGSYDKTIRVWDVESGEQLLSLKGHTGVIYGLNLSPDGFRMLSCSSDCTIKVWNMDAGLEVETLRVHNQAVLSVCYDPTGNWIVSGGVDRTLRLSKVGSNNAAVVVGRHDAAVCSVAFSGSGQYILSGGRDDVACLWDWTVAYQTATDDTPDHVGEVKHVEFSSTGTHFVSLGIDGTVILRVLDWEGRGLAAQKLTDDTEPAMAVKFSPSGIIVATLHPYGALFWNVKTGGLVGRVAEVHSLESIQFPTEVTDAVAPPVSPQLGPLKQRKAENLKGEQHRDTSVILPGLDASLVGRVDEREAELALREGGEVMMLNDGALIITSRPATGAFSNPAGNISDSATTSRPGTGFDDSLSSGALSPGKLSRGQSLTGVLVSSRPNTGAAKSRPETSGSVRFADDQKLGDEGGQATSSAQGEIRPETSGSVRFSNQGTEEGDVLSTSGDEGISRPDTGGNVRFDGGDRPQTGGSVRFSITEQGRPETSGSVRFANVEAGGEGGGAGSRPVTSGSIRFAHGSGEGDVPNSAGGGEGVSGPDTLGNVHFDGGDRPQTGGSVRFSNMEQGRPRTQGSVRFEAPLEDDDGDERRPRTHGSVRFASGESSPGAQGDGLGPQRPLTAGGAPGTPSAVMLRGDDSGDDGAVQASAVGGGADVLEISAVGDDDGGGDEEGVSEVRDDFSGGGRLSSAVVGEILVIHEEDGSPLGQAGGVLSPIESPVEWTRVGGDMAWEEVDRGEEGRGAQGLEVEGDQGERQEREHESTSAQGEGQEQGNESAGVSVQKEEMNQVVELENGDVGETGAVEPGAADETGAVEPGAADETGAVEPGAADETGAVEPGAADETGAVEPGAADETGAGEPGAADETGAVVPGAADETGAVEPGAADETGAGEPGAADETGAWKPDATDEDFVDEDAEIEQVISQFKERMRTPPHKGGQFALTDPVSESEMSQGGLDSISVAGEELGSDSVAASSNASKAASPHAMAATPFGALMKKLTGESQDQVDDPSLPRIEPWGGNKSSSPALAPGDISTDEVDGGLNGEGGGEGVPTSRAEEALKRAGIKTRRQLAEGRRMGATSPVSDRPREEFGNLDPVTAWDGSYEYGRGVEYDQKRWAEAQAALEAGEVVDASVFLTKTFKRDEHSAGFRTLLEGWMMASNLFFRGVKEESDLILEETRKEEAKRLALIEKVENEFLGKVLEEGERVDVWEKSKFGRKMFDRLDVLKRREEAVDPLLAGLRASGTSEEEAAALFNKIDVNKDGGLDQSELRLALNQRGITLTDDELQEVFDRVDTDGNGKIDADEFKALFSGLAINSASIMGGRFGLAQEEVGAEQQGSGVDGSAAHDVELSAFASLIAEAESSNDPNVAAAAAPYAGGGGDAIDAAGSGGGGGGAGVDDGNADGAGDAEVSPSNKLGQSFGSHEASAEVDSPGRQFATLKSWGPVNGGDDDDDDDDQVAVGDDTPLWAFSGLLAELEGRRQKQPNKVRRPSRSGNRAKETTLGATADAYDTDMPGAEINPRSIQKVLFTLDKLEASTDPKSTFFGESAEIITSLKEEPLCSRAICIPMRGIPSLSQLVTETILPYLAHPEPRVMISAASALAVTSMPTASHVMEALGKLVSHEQVTVRHAGVQAIGRLEAKRQGEDDLYDPNVKKTLTVVVVGARDLFAADANGKSDPFVTVQIMDAGHNQAQGADVDDLLGSNRTPMEEIELEDPDFVDLAMRRMMMRSCLLFEMLTAPQLRDCLIASTAVSLGTDQVLMYQGEKCECLYMVVSGVMRVMVDIELAKGEVQTDKRGGTASEGRAQSRATSSRGSTRDGYGQQVALLDSGDTIGEMNLFLQDPAGATVIANTECRLVELTQETVQWLRKVRPDVVEALNKRALSERNFFVDQTKKGVSKQRKTKVKFQTLEPEWQETFVFSGVHMDSTCVLTVYDHDIVGSHDFIGNASISVEQLPLGVECDEWLELCARTEEDDVGGEIQVRVKLEVDKRPRIFLPNGSALVVNVKEKSIVLEVETDADEEPSVATSWILSSTISSFDISKHDPRVIALGSITGGVYLLRVQDILNYKYELEMRSGARSPANGVPAIAE